MDFQLTEEQELTRRTVREFAEKEIAPRSRQLDELQEFPLDLMARLGQ